jgi:alanine or glycine:cation symporter, AGCS family
MAVIENIVGSISNFFWGPPLFIMVLGTGLYLTIATKGVYQLKVMFHMKNTFGTMFNRDLKGEGTVSGFAAAATAIASTIGTGNVSGVAVAITMGGPGALFWMWMTAMVGMATKAAEIILGQRYRVKFESIDEYLCGRNYVMKNALKWNALAVVLAWQAMITAPWSLLVQTNAVAASLNTAFGLPMMFGIVAIVISLGVTIIGGVRRIAAVADKVVPFMALLYIFAGILLIFKNFALIPSVFSSIVVSAFTPAAPVGGFAGASVALATRWGIARGVYSNESGMGSGMGAHAAAITDHPVRQASWGWGENFIDTIVVCTITGFAILFTGAHINHPGVTGAALTTQAFIDTFGAIGGYIVAIAGVLFAWTTLLSAYYGNEKSVNYIFGDTSTNKMMMKFFIAYFLLPIFLSGADTGLLWLVTDTATIIGVVATIVIIWAMRKEILRLHNDFYDRYLPALEAGQNPPPVHYVTKA